MRTKLRIALISCAVAALTLPNESARAQANTSDEVVVRGDDIGSAYGAPGGFSRTRFAPLTTAYVLPPGVFYFGEVYEGDAFRHGPPDHLFTQELEVGLPYRFGVAVESQFERFNGGGGPETVSIETRYALADWGKIPLNPTLFFEYKFGVGPIRREEIMPDFEEGSMPEEMKAALRQSRVHNRALAEEEEGEEEEGGPPNRPDAYEFRLLLADEFFGRIEWALNGFFEQETSLDEGREWGFAQSAVTPVLLPREQLKVGIEMQYKNLTVKGMRDEPAESFVIGPTMAFRTSQNTRFDVSTMFGCTEDSPHVQVFAVFSWLLGEGGGEHETEAPVSTRNR